MTILLAIVIPFLVQAAASPESAVRALYDAFNKRDAAALVKLTSPDVRWMSVTGDSIKVETSGREPLQAYLTRYFTSLPTVQSKIESLMPAGNYVTVHERVTWQSSKGERTQSALAVYQVVNGEIAAVWYYEVMK